MFRFPCSIDRAYTLTGARMKEIQAVNACRKEAIAGGMLLEQAMQTWQSAADLPESYRTNL